MMDAATLSVHSRIRGEAAHAEAGTVSVVFQNHYVS